MRNVISGATGSPHLQTRDSSIPPYAQDRMGCSTSSQTSAVDTTRPGAKPEESNGAATGVAGDNGKIAEDSETIPDQTPTGGSDAKPDSEPAATATSADSTSANPPPGEGAQPAADSPPAETPAADSNAETAVSSSEAAAPDQAAETSPEEKTEAAPAPSE